MSLRRRSSLITALAMLAVLVGTLAPATVTAEDVRFYIGSAIDPGDAMYIREGVRLGQTYIGDGLGIDVKTPTIINAVPAEPRGNLDLVGLSTSHAVVVFTGSGGWEQSAPFDRVHVVVHEYFHVVQQELAGERQDAPLWIDEGLAEYIGFQAVIEVGLVSAEDVENYNALQVLADRPLPPLANLESPQDFQSQSPSVYGLSYLAVKRLVGDRPSSIRRYYQGLASGDGWRSAFKSAFRVNPTTFYDAFEASRADISAPFQLPESFAPVDVANTPADVSLDAGSTALIRGDQWLLRAESSAGAQCSLSVATRSGGELLDLPTFADATGSLFWFWTVPTDARRATVTASVDCGGDPVTTRLTIE